MAQAHDTAGLQMGAALCYSVYTLRQSKRMDLGKAAALSSSCLLLGALLGGLLAWGIGVDPAHPVGVRRLGGGAWSVGVHVRAGICMWCHVSACVYVKILCGDMSMR